MSVSLCAEPKKKALALRMSLKDQDSRNDDERIFKRNA